MKTIRKSVSLKTFVTAIMIMLAFAGLTFNLGRAGYVGDETEQWYTPSQEATYIVGPYNSTHYYMQNHTGHGYSGYEGYDFLSTNDDTVIQYAIDNVTTDGGSVFVKSGTYTATVVLKTLVRLILDKNAATITVSINAGATAILEDYNAGRIRYWVSGSLMYDEDMTAGSLTLVDGIYSGWANATNLEFSTGLWYGNLNRTDSIVNPIGMASYIVDVSGSTYRMKNVTTGQIDFQSTNVTKVEQFALGNMTNGLLFLKEVVHNTSLTLTDTQFIIESYQGQYKTYSTQAQFYIPQIAGDPTNLTALNYGKVWYDTVLGKLKFWDGTAIQILPSLTGGANNTRSASQYIVYSVGATCYMVDTDGNIDYSSTNASKVINFALANLTSGRTGKEQVIVQGPITITNPIVYGRHTRLTFQNTITLGNGANCHMIQNNDTTNGDFDVIIEGGYLNGNSANNDYETNDIIYWKQTTDAAGTDRGSIIIQDMKLWYGDRSGIAMIMHSSDASFLHLLNLNVRFSAHGFGLWLNCTNDAEISNSFISGNGGDIFINKSSCIFMNNIYTGDLVQFNDSCNLALTNFWMDGRTNDPVLGLYGVRYSVFTNGYVDVFESDGVNITGIYLASTATYHSINNQFCNIIIGRMAASGTNRFDYGILEANSNQDFNSYTLINTRDNYGTTGIVTAGADSYVTNSWNGTTHIP